MNYSQEEINQILLSKNLNEFYLATMEHREELLTDEEYERISKKEIIISGDNKEEVKDLFKKIETDERLKEFAPEIMKFIYSLSQIRYFAILTMIGDEFYNIAEARFEDLRRNKIIHYDNLTNYYNESNARIRFFTPEEEPILTGNTVLLDVDDESIVYEYERIHVKQEESEDLTSNFIREFKGKPYTLSKKTNNE